MSDNTHLYYLTIGGITPDDTLTDVTLTDGTVAASTTVTGISGIENGTPRGISFVPEDGVYFITTTEGETSSIFEETMGQPLDFPSPVYSFTNPSGVYQLTESLGVDAANNDIYFMSDSSLYTERFGAGFSGTPDIVNLGTAPQATGAMVYDQAENTVFYAGVTGSIYTNFGVTTGHIHSNYIYKVSGLGPAATAGTVSNALAGGAQVPLSDGTVEGMALDTATDTLYFTTNPTPDLGSTPSAGIYALALNGPDAGQITTIYAQQITDFSSPFAQMGSIAIDSSTGDYYIDTMSGTTGTAGEIYVGNVNDIGTAPVLLEDTGGNGGGEDGEAVPLALGVYTPPPPALTVTGTGTDALQGGSSITALAAAPAITDMSGTLAGADVVLENAQAGDVLGINGATSGTLFSGAINYSFAGNELSLSGSATLAEYETALSEVTYQDGGTDGSTGGHPVRVLDWSVTNGVQTSATQSSSITIDRSLTLSAGGTVTVALGGSVAVDAGIGITDLDGDAVTSAVAAIVAGFQTGDELNFINQNGITGSYDAGTGTLSLSGSASAADYQAALASVTYTSLAPDPATGPDAQRSIGYEVADAAGVGNFGFSDVFLLCYLHGTRILAAHGQVAVEDLAIGDMVATRHGGLRAIKWIGRQRFDPRFARHNRSKIPVRIAAGALGGGLPLRDLFVSPGHSMLLGSTLVLARNLVNGVTITQELPAAEISYVQIELETHDCVLAEGAWSESYADAPGLRAQFHNAAEFWALYPDYVTPDDVQLCLPRPQHGPELAAALAPVVALVDAAPGGLQGWVDRIGADGLIQGWAVDLAQPELPVLLEVLLGRKILGRILACDPREDLRAAGYGQGHCGFTFASGRSFTQVEMAQIQVRRVADSCELNFTSILRARLAA